ncbi:retrovirus-related pol polyprotein from transposon TNT 1-94 [Tanacetum coccineum]|uniref:Retrovirus-related pol polyprotein from transposon TNT 1-94 n=1 Tax=Tanacetum coccineum TaxID=301880 RepID=A0ABQ5B0I4_9ASTR
MVSNEETNAAGTDTRPPMLVESRPTDSWKIVIHRYIRGKPNGKLIWKSIQNGPTPHPMITDPPPTGSTIVPRLPRHIFNILNQTSTAKEIWDNVELLMQGNQIVTEPVQRKAPGNVGNTGARGKKVICYNCRGEGHVARQCKEPKRAKDSQYFKDKMLLMEAKEKGATP